MNSGSSDLEVDLLFFDTASIYFELDQADATLTRDERAYPPPPRPRPPPARARPPRAAWSRTAPRTAVQDGGGGSGGVGFRAYGKSKDSRDDLPQIVIGMAIYPRRDPGAGVVLARQHQRLR